MKKTIVTVVIEFEDLPEDVVKNVISDAFFGILNSNETYNIVNIEDIEE